MIIMLYSCSVWFLQSGSFHQSEAFPKILTLAVVPQREDECEAVVPPSSVETSGCYWQPRSGVVWINVNYMAMALNVYRAITLCCEQTTFQYQLSCRDHSDETSALVLHTLLPCAAARCALPLKCGEEIEMLKCQDSGSLWLTWLTWLMWLCIHDATWQHRLPIFHASRPGPASMRLITPIHPVRPPKKPRAPFSMIPQIA